MHHDYGRDGHIPLGAPVLPSGVSPQLPVRPADDRWFFHFTSSLPHAGSTLRSASFSQATIIPVYATTSIPGSNISTGVPMTAVGDRWALPCHLLPGYILEALTIRASTMRTSLRLIAQLEAKWTQSKNKR